MNRHEPTIAANCHNAEFVMAGTSDTTPVVVRVSVSGLAADYMRLRRFIEQRNDWRKVKRTR